MRNKFLLVCMILGSFAAVNKTYALDGGVAPSYKDVINNYIDGYVNGNYKKLDKVLSDDASVKIPRADVVLVHSKNNLMEQLKKDGNGVKQNCQSNYEVVAKSDAMIIAKVDFKYNDFTQHNYLVLEKNENKEWKITQVCKFFEDAKTKVDTAPAPNITASNN
jgi:hypothetical protein